jgi:hypothetical protein
MSDAKSECPKCAGVMEQGFIPDHAYGVDLVAKWHRGSPKKAYWTGVNVPAVGGLPIAAFRCSKCGFLEFFAGREFAAS